MERARVKNWCSAIQRRKALLDIGAEDGIPSM